MKNVGTIFSTVVVLILLLAVLTVSGAPSGKFPIAKSHPTIKHVSAENFRQEVIDPTIPVVLQFYKPGDKQSKKFSEVFEVAAESLEGFATFKVMDATTQDGQGVAQMFGLQYFPAVVIFNPEMLPVAGQGAQDGQYMKMPVPFNGKKTAEALTSWVLASIDGHQIEVIEDEVDLNDFLLKYQHFELPKIILFQKKSNITAPSFKVMSHIHRYGALFGVVSPTAGPEISERFAVESTPAVISVTTGDDVDIMKNVEDANLESLNTFISRVALTKEKKQQMQAIYLEEESKQRKKEAEEAKMNKALPVQIIEDAESWNKYCLKLKKGVCVAIFLDGLPKNKEEIPQLEMLNNCSRKIAPRTQSPVQFVILDGLYNYQLVNKFEANDGLPAVVYLSPGKKTYQNHIGSFQERSIINFYIDKVGKARGKKYDLKKLPEFAVTPVEEADDGAAGDEEGDELSDEM